MKKFIYLLTLAGVIILFGCNQKQETKTSNTLKTSTQTMQEIKIESTTESTTELNTTKSTSSPLSTTKLATKNNAWKLLEQNSKIFKDDLSTNEVLNYSMEIPNDWIISSGGSILDYSDGKKAAEIISPFFVSSEIIEKMKSSKFFENYEMTIKSHKVYNTPVLKGFKICASDISSMFGVEKEYMLYRYFLYNEKCGMYITFYSLNGKPETENEKLYDQIINSLKFY